MFLTASAMVDLCLLLILGLVVGHSIYQWRKSAWLFCDPLNLFWVAALTCYVLQPVMFYDVFVSWHNEEVIVQTLLWVVFGFVFVILGYELAIGRRLGAALPATPARLDGGRLTALGMLLIAGGIAGYGYLMASAGGPANWLAVSRGGTDVESATGYLAQLEHLLPLGVLLLCFHIRMHRPGGLQTTIVVALTILMVLAFVYLGSRSRVINLTLGILAAWYLPSRRNPSPFVVAGLFLFMFISSQFIGLYRANFANLSFNLDRIDVAEARGVVLPSFLGGDSSAQHDRVSGGIEFNVVLSVIELVPEVVPYNFGYGHLEMFTRPIPRQLWPDKRYPHMESVQGVLRAGNLTGATVPTSSRPLLAGPSFTFVGHWYYVGGPVGLVIGGIITGMLFRMIRTIYDRAPGREGDIVLFANLIMIGFHEAVTTPFLFLVTLPFQLSPLLLVFWLARSPEPRGLPALRGVRRRVSA